MSDLLKITGDVLAELARATAKHGPMASSMEGQAIIDEENDEFTEEVRHGTKEAATKEAVQLAAMAIKWLYQFGVGYSAHKTDHQRLAAIDLIRMRGDRGAPADRNRMQVKGDPQ